MLSKTNSDWKNVRRDFPALSRFPKNQLEIWNLDLPTSDLRSRLILRVTNGGQTFQKQRSTMSGWSLLKTRRSSRIDWTWEKTIHYIFISILSWFQSPYKLEASSDLKTGKNQLKDDRIFLSWSWLHVEIESSKPIKPSAEQQRSKALNTWQKMLPKKHHDTTADSCRFVLLETRAGVNRCQSVMYQNDSPVYHQLWWMCRREHFPSRYITFLVQRRTRWRHQLVSQRGYGLQRGEDIRYPVWWTGHYQKEVWNTPPKFNFEAENHQLEKEIYIFQIPMFGVPCQFSGGGKFTQHGWLTPRFLRFNGWKSAAQASKPQSLT